MAPATTLLFNYILFILDNKMIEISEYLKAPDAIGETTPAAATFSTIKRTTGVTESDSEEICPLGFNDPRYFTYHGIEAVGALSFDNAEHSLTVASVTYWYHGVKYTTAAATTCDLDLTADRDHLNATLTAGGTYYIYFKDASGKLYWSPTAWDLKAIVPVATVFWTGSAGCVCLKTHNHTRDLDWHISSSPRYASGFEHMKPAAAFDDDLQVLEGIFYDADLKVEIAEQTSCRIFYMSSIGSYTSVESTLPYAGTTGIPQYLCTSGYALQAPESTNFVCYWVYATSDIAKPIYVVPTHADTAHPTLAAARLEEPPAVDWLLLYRYIYSGDGEFVEYATAGTEVAQATGGGLDWVAVTAGTTAAENSKGYLVNATAGNVTITLPATPAEGDTVGVCDVYRQATTNVITIARNTQKIESNATDLILDVNGAGFTLVYTDSTIGWKIVSEIGSNDVNGVTLASAATGFTISGGTSSKTLTVSTTLDTADIPTRGYIIALAIALGD